MGDIIELKKVREEKEAKLKEYVEHEVKEILDEFDSQIFPIEIETSYEIVFYIIPVEDVDYIRDKIIELKKEAI